MRAVNGGNGAAHLRAEALTVGSVDQADSRPLRIVVVVGSPRVRGNSAALVDVVREAATAAAAANPALAAELEVIWPAALDIAGCTACRGCDRTGTCTTPDAMAPIYDSLDGAEALLWISPVYFGSVPSQLKAFIDRFQVYWARRVLRTSSGTTSPYHARRPSSLILIRGGGDPFGSACAVTPIRAASQLAEFTLSEPLVVEGPDTDTPIGADRFAAERAEVAARATALLVAARAWRDGAR